MYEVTCPSCQHVMRSPFVRIGAAGDCTRCHHRWQITEGHVRREGMQATLADEALTPVANSRPASPIPLDGVNDKPASEKPLITPAPEAAKTPKAPPPAAVSPSAPSPAVSPELPASVTQRVSDRLSTSQHVVAKFGLNMVSMVVFAVLIASAMLAAIWFERHMNQQRDEATTTNALDTTSATNATSASPTGGNDSQPVRQVQVTSAPVLPTGWRVVDEPVEPQPQRRLIVLSDVSYEVRPLSDTVVFRAKISLNDNGACSNVVVRLALIDENNRVFTRADMPLALLSKRTPQWIELPMPRHLSDRVRTVDWQTDIGRRIPVSLFLEASDIQVEQLGEGNDTAVRVTAHNRWANPLQGVVCVVSAVDAEHRVVAQWRVELNEPVGAGESVRFDVATPVDASWQIAQWHVEAVGEPVAELK